MLPRLYIITDDTGDPLTQVAAALAAVPPGAAMVQLRRKHAATRPLLDLARALHAITTRHRAPLLLNERLDLALAANLEGVHLPATGLDPATARTITPPSFLIGASIHSPAESSTPADFLLLAPIFATPSKPNTTPLTLTALTETTTRCTTPLFALGGIDTADRAAAAIAAGAHGIAGIRAFLSPTTLASLHAAI